jgi:hypothetical protein
MTGLLTPLKIPPRQQDANGKAAELPGCVSWRFAAKGQAMRQKNINI